jgi:hypothetical protein
MSSHPAELPFILVLSDTDIPAHGNLALYATFLVSLSCRSIRNPIDSPPRVWLMVWKNSASELLAIAGHKLPKANFLRMCMSSVHQVPIRITSAVLPSVTSVTFLGFHHDILPSRRCSWSLCHMALQPFSSKPFWASTLIFSSIFISLMSGYASFYPPCDPLPLSPCTSSGMAQYH